MNSQRRIFITGASFAFICVALGAFGAHALKEVLSDSASHQYELAIRYAFMHALALMIIALAHPIAVNEKKINLAAWFFGAGICLFSGSLILLALSGNHVFAVFTPLGGLCFLIGWVSLILSMRGR